MKRLVFLYLNVCLWGCCAILTEKVQKRKYPLKEQTPVFRTVQFGNSVTLTCPVRPAVARMYRYLRHTKSGKELEHARRKLALLLGVKYRWYKDGRSIKHHRSVWFMKFQRIRTEDAGVYMCKVINIKDGMSRNFTLKVIKSPKNGRPIIKSKSTNITLREGESTTLECISKNTRRRPQIRWLKIPKTRSFWALQDSRFTRRGVKNPIFSNADRYKVIDTKYYEKGRKRRVKSKTSHIFRLKLKNVKESDAGVYVCLIRNKHGRSFSNFFVAVKSMKGVAPYPTNPQKMSRQFIAWPAASSVKLKCYVTGDKPLTFQWYKDGRKLVYRRLDPRLNSSTWALRLRVLVPSDSGVYTCVVSNPFGVFKHSTTVKVIERTRSSPILHDGYPKNVTSTRGTNVSFDCIEVVSGPLPDYRWYKWHSVPASYPNLNFSDRSQFTEIDPIHYNTIEVKVGRRYRFGVRVTLKNITEHDMGLYTCKATNIIGMDYSSAFLKLDVNEGPKFVTAVYRPDEINVPATAPLTLDCDAKGEPKPVVDWFKDGEPLTPINDVIMTNYTLKLYELTPGHSGNYSCVVSNEMGSINHTFRVKIEERLFSRPIIIPPVKKLLKLGDRYELKCTIVSSKILDVHWLRDLDTKRKVLFSGDAQLVKLDKQVYKYSYVIQNASLGDSGVYWCVAKNDFGESQRKFRIVVQA